MIQDLSTGDALVETPWIRMASVGNLGRL